MAGMGRGCRLATCTGLAERGADGHRTRGCMMGRFLALFLREPEEDAGWAAGERRFDELVPELELSTMG